MNGQYWEVTEDAVMGGYYTRTWANSTDSIPKHTIHYTSKYQLYITVAYTQYIAPSETVDSAE